MQPSQIPVTAQSLSTADVRVAEPLRPPAQIGIVLEDVEPAQGVAVLPTPVPTPEPAIVAPAGSSDAKSFIYEHESGNNPAAINPGSGACGLGQALPCSKMPCSLSDYACQDAFFTGYMQDRYGTWENARAFWLAHRWW